MAEGSPRREGKPEKARATYLGTENQDALIMSRSYYKVYSYTCGIKSNAAYFRSCAREYRRKHKSMLRYALDNRPLEEVDELLYTIPKRAVYDLWGAPHDYFLFETKSSLSDKIDGVFHDWFRYEYYCVEELRRYLIIRSRLKGYVLHRRRKYSYKECEDAFQQ